MSLDLAKNEVRVSWRYPHSLAAVYRAVSEGRLLMTCGGRMHDFRHDFRVGGAYQYAWAPGKTCKGEYLEIVGPGPGGAGARVRWTWDDCNAGVGAVPSEVTATLSTQGAYTVLEILHVKAPSADLAHSYHQGWTEVLALFRDELDGTTIRVRKDFTVDRKTLFHALGRGGLFRFTVPGEAEFGRGSIDFREGGRYEYPCGKDDYVRGEFTKIVADEQVRFTWSTFCGGEKVDGTEVLIFLESLAGGGTRLHLVHDGLVSAKISEMHLEGWRDSLEEFAKACR